MTKVKASKARNDFPELIARAGYGGERFVIERRGKAIAAIISYADLERLEALEDARDSANLQRAIAENEGFTDIETILATCVNE